MRESRAVVIDMWECLSPAENFKVGIHLEKHSSRNCDKIPSGICTQAEKKNNCPLNFSDHVTEKTQLAFDKNFQESLKHFWFGDDQVSSSN